MMGLKKLLLNKGSGEDSTLGSLKKQVPRRKGERGGQQRYALGFPPPKMAVGKARGWTGS